MGDVISTGGCSMILFVYVLFWLSMIPVLPLWYQVHLFCLLRWWPSRSFALEVHSAFVGHFHCCSDTVGGYSVSSFSCCCAGDTILGGDAFHLPVMYYHHRYLLPSWLEAYLGVFSIFCSPIVYFDDAFSAFVASRYLMLLPVVLDFWPTVLPYHSTTRLGGHAVFLLWRWLFWRDTIRWPGGSDFAEYTQPPFLSLMELGWEVSLAVVVPFLLECLPTVPWKADACPTCPGGPRCISLGIPTSPLWGSAVAYLLMFSSSAWAFAFSLGHSAIHWSDLYTGIAMPISLYLPGIVVLITSALEYCLQFGLLLGILCHHSAFDDSSPFCSNSLFWYDAVHSIAFDLLPVEYSILHSAPLLLFYAVVECPLHSVVRGRWLPAFFDAVLHLAFSSVVMPVMEVCCFWYFRTILLWSIHYKLLCVVIFHYSSDRNAVRDCVTIVALSRKWLSIVYLVTLLLKYSYIWRDTLMILLFWKLLLSIDDIAVIPFHWCLRWKYCLILLFLLEVHYSFVDIYHWCCWYLLLLMLPLLLLLFPWYCCWYSLIHSVMEYDVTAIQVFVRYLPFDVDLRWLFRSKYFDDILHLLPHSIDLYSWVFLLVISLFLFLLFWKVMVLWATVYILQSDCSFYSTMIHFVIVPFHTILLERVIDISVFIT